MNSAHLKELGQVGSGARKNGAVVKSRHQHWRACRAMMQVSLLMVGLGLMAPEAARAYSSGITQASGRPGQSYSANKCNSCHGWAQNATVTLKRIDANGNQITAALLPGEQGTFAVSSNSTLPGFNVASNAGALDVDASETTSTQKINSEITHKSARKTGPATYRFKYTMPANAAAAETLYAAAGNGGSFNFTTLSVAVAAPTPTATPTPTPTPLPPGSSGTFYVSNTGNNANLGTVDQPFKTITHAMAVSAAGASIRVSPGTYNVAGGETFPITVKSGVQLISLSGPLSTVIDASGANERVLRCSANAATTSVEGFTIQGGLETDAPGYQTRGGGIFCTNNDFTVISRNIIKNNQARGYNGFDTTYVSGSAAFGGGIYVETGSPTIINNVFSGNIARGGNGFNNFGVGGGSAGYGAGGGLYVSGGAPLVINNTFDGNSAIGGTGGSGGFAAGGSGGNADSGGAYLAGAVARNNIFVNNVATGSAGGSTGGAAGSGTNGGASTFNTLTHSLFFNNSAATAPDGNTGTNAIIGQNPQFVAAGDFHLKATSPAVNAGTLINAPSVDIDGQLRTNPDIGADEFVLPPALFVSDVAVLEKLSGTTDATFIVSLSTASAFTVTVNFATGDGSAVGGSDYQSTSGQLTFAPGQTVKTVTVTVLGDTIFENPETFGLNLAGPSNATLGDAQGIATISNAGPTTINVSIAPSGISENGASATGTVTLDAGSGTNLSIALSSSNPARVSVPAEVTIPVGSNSATFIVTSIDDAVADTDLFFTVTASAPGLVTGSGSLTLQDDDTARLSLNVDQSTLIEGGAAATATVSRNTPTTLPLEVTLASNGPGVLNMPATVSIPANSSSVTFQIASIDNLIAEGTRAAVVTASATGLASADVNISITDNDTPTLALSIAPNSISETGTATATVSHNTPLASPVVVTLSNTHNAQANVPTSVTIPAGSSSANFQIAAINDIVADGIQQLTIGAAAPGFTGDIASLSVTDDDTPLLQLSVAPSTFSENGGTVAATGIIRRNTPINTALTVTLASSDASEARVPTSVTIAAGSTLATFPVAAIDDLVADGSQIAIISAAASGFARQTLGVTVLDNEAKLLSLTIAPTTFGENGGATAAVGTIVRNTPTNAALTVALASNDTSEARVPTSVTFAIGKSSVAFPISAIDDLLADGSQGVTITGRASGFLPVEAALTVNDNEPGGGNLSVVLNRFAESAGVNAARGTITLNSAATAPVTFTLSGSARSEVGLPPSVTIAAGSTSATFAVGAVDDALADGPQDVLITAASGGLSLESTIIVLDNEIATLSLNITPTSFAENSGATVRGTITRNTPTTGALVVALRSSDTTEATLPSSITIAAGSTSAAFTITAVDDAILDGTQRLTITAMASGFVPALVPLAVLDNEGPTLRLGLNKTSFAENGGATAASATITRNGATTGSLLVSLRSNDTTEANIVASATIPDGSASITVPVAAIDDLVADGTQAVTLSATAPGFNGAVAVVKVTDNETARLTLTVAPLSFSEKPASTLPRGTVTRNTPTNAPLLVFLSSADNGEVRVPGTVVIAAGRTSASFNLSPVDDTILDGTQIVRLMATAAGHALATRNVNVSDNEIAVATRSSRVALSAGRVNLSSASLQLIWSGALDDDAASNLATWSIEINGQNVEIESISLDATTSRVTLGVPENTLRSGDAVRVQWQNLRDRNGAAIADGDYELTAQ